MKKEGRFAKSISIKNRKASHEYEFIDTYEAGVVLKGSEIKSIREGKVSLPEAFCQYTEGSFNNHDPLRERKLLMKKGELEKLKKKSEEKGLTIIPTKLFINSRGFAKIQIALARGKKLYDKRESLKKKDQKKINQDLQL